MSRDDESITDTIEHLTTAECWRLLERADLGRLAMEGTDGAPDVFPVNHVVRSGHLYFRTDPGSKLSGVVRTPTVAFEADGWDGAFRWSVVMRAAASAVRLLDDAPLDEIAPAQAGDKSIVVRLVPTSISGRRFRDARTVSTPVSSDDEVPSIDRKPVHIPRLPPPGGDVTSGPRDHRP
ncbi:pyridoxamine 5'-phosphate oxidase family protein [Labedella endophytica]|uniref:Pyridoxamine 5'-phosphate oxidase family protein n=1 Tax=Labedella endophytica TaxID=1523160 RepID=A0A3S0X9V0_9MICO|nr:pyridoxamine 5'-phosphate oxidase family protein [Labedella endophytica]RUR03263.1 pyridoxamine 5'-phosphate oxidase family protein [Labedella endophytica]